MKFVTLKMVAAHVGRHPNSVRRGMLLAGLLPKEQVGVNGIRVPIKTANQFIEHQWPGAAPMGQEAK